MKISHKMLRGEMISPVDFVITVEHTRTSLFGLRRRTWVQMYRGFIVWKKYPQGTSLGWSGWEWDLQEWLDVKMLQKKWSDEFDDQESQ